MARFHRRLPSLSEEYDQVLASGELWGRAPRNIIASDIPQVLAYHGPLPVGATGYEFETAAPPSPYHPALARWIAGGEGVVAVDAETVKIYIQVTKVRRV